MKGIKNINDLIDKYLNTSKDQEFNTQEIENKFNIKVEEERAKSIENFILKKDGKIFKIARNQRSAIKIDIEISTEKFLKKNFNNYQIRTLDIIENSKGCIVRKKIDENTIGYNIGIKNFSKLQLKELERLFLKSKKFTKTTGLCLDLTIDNIYWNEERSVWILFDCGLRTSNSPRRYKYSTGVKRFEEYLKICDNIDYKLEQINKI